MRRERLQAGALPCPRARMHAGLGGAWQGGAGRGASLRAAGSVRIAASAANQEGRVGMKDWLQLR